MAKNKNKLLLFGVIGLIVLLVLGKYFYSQPKLITGSAAPNFKVMPEGGTPIQLNQLRGKYVLLDFWGSWCEPCRRDSPKLVKLFDQFNNQQFENATGFEIVSIAMEKDRTEWEKALKTDGLNWKYQHLDLNYMDSEIAKLYEVRLLPTKFLINENGIIVGIDQPIDEITEFLAKRATKN